MKINIAASHRFHLLDLARELEQNGHDVRFYSYVPKSRCMSFGLSSKASKSLYFLCLPFLALIKLSKSSDWSIRIINSCLDFLLGKFMRPCDVYIALGTVYLNSISIARDKFKAITILEWGSKHILENQKILSSIPNSKPINDYFVSRAMSGYMIADYIAISSDHVRLSFESHGIPKNKLIINPYGVDLSSFSPNFNSEKLYDLIMVGGWSYRKGCDILIEFLKKYPKISLLHVGSIVDIDIPDIENIAHVDSVDQKELSYYYSKAKIAILPSREEGLAMVQLQALACGLPLICTKDTGGRDLLKYIKGCEIVELKELSVECIFEQVVNLLGKELVSIVDSKIPSMEELTWETYGRRYSKNLEKIKKSYS